MTTAQMMLPFLLIVMWTILGYQIGRRRERTRAMRAVQRVLRDLERCEASGDDDWTVRA